jgi:cytochrome c553
MRRFRFVWLKYVRAAVLLAGSATLWVGSVSSGAAAEGNSAGARKARQDCKPCHGGRGRQTRQPGIPNLAGQDEVYLTKQLEAYRAGERRSDLMQAVAEALTDEDIANLAAYYAAQRMAYCW